MTRILRQIWTQPIVSLFSVIILISASFSSVAKTALPLTPFPHARVLYHSDIQSDDYRLSLGALKKANNVWRVKKEQRLRGDLHRDTLEIPQGFSAEEAFLHYTLQLQNMSSRELFHCYSRDCGSSSSWANTRFQIKQLYGLDRHQRYSAYEVLGTDNQVFFVALYTVMRGNKRVYAQVDILHSRDAQAGQLVASPDSIAEQLITVGYYLLPGFSVDGDTYQMNAGHIEALVTALKRKPELTIAIVGHDYKLNSIEQQKATSLEYADFIKSRVLALGVDTNRISAFGLGSLAPGRKGARTARIEIVKLN